MLTLAEYNRRNGVEATHTDGPQTEARHCDSPQGDAPREVSNAAVTHVRLLQRRHDRMRDLLNEIFVMFKIGENRQELEQTGSTGKAVLHEMDRWSEIFDDIGK